MAAKDMNSAAVVSPPPPPPPAPPPPPVLVRPWPQVQGPGPTLSEAVASHYTESGGSDFHNVNVRSPVHVVHAFPRADGTQETVRVICVADTHGDAWNIRHKIPEGDIVVLAGDYCDVRRESDAAAAFADMNRFFEDLPHKHKIYVAGNHEIYFSRRMTPETIQARLKHCIYLQDQMVEVMGVRFFGSPWNAISSMAFGSTWQELAERWRGIPSETDILVTHQPPFNIRDLASVPTRGADAQKCQVCGRRHPRYRHWGCPSLRAHVLERIHPMAHIFGHVHDCPGVEVIGGTVFINAAVALGGQPVVLDVVFDKIAPEDAQAPKERTVRSRRRCCVQ